MRLAILLMAISLVGCKEEKINAFRGTIYFNEESGSWNFFEINPVLKEERENQIIPGEKFICARPKEFEKIEKEIIKKCKD